jgi:hypothetical protein
MDCKAFLGSKPGPAGQETHGLCEECFEKRQAELEVPSVEIELAAKLALEVGVRKVQQARKDGAPVMYTAGVEATAAEIAEAILSLAKKPGVAA